SLRSLRLCGALFSYLLVSLVSWWFRLIPQPSRANRRSPAQAEVHLEEREVGDVDHPVAVEVRAGVVPKFALGLAERVLEDDEIRGADQVAVVAVTRPHQAHLHLRGWSARKGNAAPVSQGLRAFHPPVVEAVGEAA